MCVGCVVLQGANRGRANTDGVKQKNYELSMELIKHVVWKLEK